MRMFPDDWLVDRSCMIPYVPLMNTDPENALAGLPELAEQLRQVHLRQSIIMLMLCDLARASKDRETDFEFIANAINGGHHWSIIEAYDALQEPIPQQVVAETRCILDMWRTISYSYSQLSEQGKQNLRKAKGVDEPARFFGFDNRDGVRHFLVADYLVKDLNRFTELKDQELESYYPGSLERHRRMLAKYKAIEPSTEPLSEDQLKHLLMDAM